MKSRRVAHAHDPDECLSTKLDFPGDVGYDLAASTDFNLIPDQRWYVINTGVRVAPPPGFWFELCGRSSALDRGILVARGIIDAGYRGPLVIKAKNDTGRVISIAKGERLAQIIAHPIVGMDWEEVLSKSDLPESERGNNGFGSTGR